MVKSEPCPEN
jgi:hypothetical protein